MKTMNRKKMIIFGSVIIILSSVLLLGAYYEINKGIKKKVIYTSEAPKAIGPYSQAVMYGDMLFISGQLGLQPKTGELPESVEDQTKLSMNNLKAILEEARMTFGDVVQTHIFLKDIKDFQKVNEIYAKYFDGDFPARATMQVAALPKDGKVEIEMIACKQQKEKK
jgi:2-iminobutanoate/2-iminopropanoate deaminase